MVEAKTSRIVLKIRYKSFLIYLEIAEAAVGTTKTESFILRNPVGWSDNLSSDLGGSGEKLERVTEGYSRRGWLWPHIKVILALISFSKNTLPNGLVDPLGIEKLEL